MQNDLLTILQHQGLPIENAQLIAYLKGELDAQQEHAVEMVLEGSPIDAEVLEGLRHLKQPGQISRLTIELDQALQAKLKQQKKNDRKPIKMGVNLWAAIALGLLLLAALGWFLVNNYLNP